MDYFIFCSLMLLLLAYMVLASRDDVKKSVRIKFSCIVFIILFLNVISFAVSDFLFLFKSKYLLFYIKKFMTITVLFEYKHVILDLLYGLIVSAIISVLTYKSFAWSFLKNKISKVSHLYISLIIVASFLNVPVVYNMLVDIYGTAYRFVNREIYSTYFKSDFVDPFDYDRNVSNKPNIVYIYLESFERSYLDKEVFSDIADEIYKLEKESLYFTGVEQTDYAGMTIAGMVASQCAIPFLDLYTGMNERTFLNNLNCLGDILKDEGYYLHYLGGADINYSNKGDFYKTHGFAAVEGKDELIGYLDDKTYITDWGMYDDSIFDIAYKRFETLAEKEQPFGLFMLTLDTHGYEGYLSKSCEHLRDDDKASIYNSVKCTSYLVTNFIEKIRNSRWSDNTIIVVSSDHLTPQSSSIELSKYYNRRNLFFINFPNNQKVGEVNKQGSMFDVASTILDAIGFGVDRLGLGVSLLREVDTLISQDYYKNLVEYTLDNYHKYFGFVNLQNGVSYMDNTFSVGDRNILSTVIFHLNHKGVIRSFMLGNNLNEEYLYNEKDNRFSVLYNNYSTLEDGDRVLWHDSCYYQALFLESPDKNEKNRTCLFIGRKGSDKYFFDYSENINNISFKDIVNYIK